MESKSASASNDIRQKLELFLSYWKVILFCLVVSLLICYTYLRYTTYEYNATATIKIKDEKQSNKLPSLESLSSEGLFSQGTDKIKDEIQIILSRSLIENVITKLKLNINYYEQGKIKEKQLYGNPPVRISFFDNDSVVNTISTTLYIKVKSASKFLIFKDEGKSFLNRDESEGDLYAFGDKINRGFGDFVLTPNLGSSTPKPGSNLRISISPVKKIVGAYQKKIKISTDKGSSVLNLSLQETVPQKAIDILDALIEEYNKDVLYDKEAVVKATSEFIDNRLQKVSEELEAVDFTAEQLQKQNNLTALNSQANLFLESEKQTEAQINSTANTIQLIDYLQEEIQKKNKNSDLLPPNIISDPNISQVTKNHNELVAQRDRILKNSSEKNPVVINLNNQIEALKSNLESSLKNMKESSQITLNNLNREEARIRGQLYSAPTKQRKFRDIERQQGIKESLYLYLLEKREESTIRFGMYSPNAKIIDNAYSSFKPVAPNKMITYLASIIFGLAIPIGFIYVKDLIDTKIYRKEDLVNILDVPYLGDIPKTSNKSLLIKKVDYSPKAEAFRIVRSNIDFMLRGIDGRAKKIFITSTKAQEGKSHTSSNLATSISHSEKSVLLIETDIRMPKLLSYLGLDNESKKGLSDFIVDKSIKPQDIVVKHKDNKFLDIIPSGTIPPNPSELLMSDRVEELFNYFEDKYDYVIVDTSAVGLVSDTLLISKFADMFVYVVSADKIDKRLLVHVAKPLYEKDRLPHMTMLLNGTETNKQGYGYGYGYGYGSDVKNEKKWYKFWA